MSRGLDIPLERWTTTVTYYLTPIIVAIKKKKALARM